MADAPKLATVAPEDLIAEIVADWEELAGVTLYPGQVAYQQAMMAVNREVQLRAQIDYNTAQNLTMFATGTALDYKAAAWGVYRLAAQAAICTLRFTLNAHTGVTIPANTRASSTDGSIVMATDYEMVIPTGVLSVDVPATCTIVGTFPNNKAVGSISVIIDAIPFVQSVSNIDVIEGGSEEENDEQLRARVLLAPSTFSTTGSIKAYKFHTASASPRIIDSAVLNGGDGVVNVYPLVGGGIETPSAILSLVAGRLNDDDIRPINDTINVISPTKLTYTLSVNIWLRWGVVSSVAIERVLAALNAYVAKTQLKLGENITIGQLTAIALKDNLDIVVDVSFVGFTGLTVPPTDFAVCEGITINQVFYEDPAN